MSEVTYKWINGEVPEDLEIKQVYGIVFDENFNVFLRKYEGQYFLTGGRPEPFDKTREDTLRREFLEEANMTIKNIHMAGYQLVEEGNGTKPFAQIRMIAQVDKMGENRPDTDNGKLYERLFVPPAEAIKLLNWGESGKAQIEDGYRLAKKYYIDSLTFQENTTMIELIKSPETKQTIARKILEALHDWFEVEENREKYISTCVNWTFLAAKEKDEYVGFLCLKETSKETVELAVMGVLKEYHRKGIGTKLFETADKIATDSGYSFMQVKTVQLGVYPDYDITNRFYQACGFKELEVIKEIWGEENPCQIYVRYLK